jgi:hypothetical protein
MEVCPLSYLLIFTSHSTRPNRSIFSIVSLLNYTRGTGLSSPENPDESEAALNAEIDKLNRQELQLDENLRTVQADLKRLAEESANSRFVHILYSFGSILTYCSGLLL